jgi:hexosaminidase
VSESYQHLKPESRSNILGVQAQLWSETIKGRDMIEYYMLPKLIGFAESAWAAQRPWETMADRQQREQSMATGWNVMANCIGQRELPRLGMINGGYNYRVPPPGGKFEQGWLKANTAFPGLVIRYTLDGSQPGLQSAIYQAPLKVDGPVSLRAFDSAGQASRVITVSP